MDRSKRTITKPARYQTTSSDEAPRIKTVDGTRVQNMGNIEDDINDLQMVIEKDPSQDNAHSTQNEFTKCVNTLAQTRSHVQYLPPTCSQYTILQDFLHTAQYGTYSSAPDMEQSTSTIRAIAHVPNEGYQTNMCTNTGSLHNIDNRNIHDRINNMEAELKKISKTMEHILKCIQVKNKNRIPQKPTLLPIATVEEMMEFENIDDEAYEEVVNYFHHVGGFTAKEAINLAIKEAVKDYITIMYTWFGREEGVHPLYNTRIIMAIYDSVCNNNYFLKPTRAEFQNIAREALRSAKQRHRTSTRILRNRERQARAARHFWDDSHAENEPPQINENVEEL